MRQYAAATAADRRPYGLRQHAANEA